MLCQVVETIRNQSVRDTSSLQKVEERRTSLPNKLINHLIVFSRIDEIRRIDRNRALRRASHSRLAAAVKSGVDLVDFTAVHGVTAGVFAGAFVCVAEGFEVQRSMYVKA